MEYQKLINLLDHTTNQRSKFRTRNWFEINDKSRGCYNNYTNHDDDNNNIKLMKIMIRSSLCDYSDRNILFKRTITFPIRQLKVWQ